MTAQFLRAFTEFNLPATTDSNADLLSLGETKGDKGNPTSLFFKTLGKLNHSYESTESLASDYGSRGSYDSFQSKDSMENLSVFSAVERLTLNSYSSAGNLLNDCPAVPARTSMGTFFAALQEYLSVHVHGDEDGDGEGFSAPEEGGAETIFPKLC